MSIEQGKKLREFRKKNKMTQEQVARLLNVSRQNYSHYETGRNQPSIDSMMILSRIWQISIEELLSDESNSSLLRETNPYGNATDKFNSSTLLYNSETFIQESELLNTFRSLSENQKNEVLHFAKFMSEN